MGMMVTLTSFPIGVVSLDYGNLILPILVPFELLSFHGKMVALKRDEECNIYQQYDHPSDNENI